MEGLTLTLTLLVIAAVLLGWRNSRVARFTSLLAAARWDAISLVGIAAVELFVGSSSEKVDSSWIAPLRWVAASTIFCGWMARLGARRPHGAGWQFVVATLWGVLALPAAEVFFLQSGQSFEIHAARGFFLWLMIAGGLANSLPTRLWISGLLAAAGQVLLLAEHLPGIRYDFESARDLRASIVGAIVVLVSAQLCRAIVEWKAARRSGLTGVWLDFRDQFGAWWGLRLQERVNATAILGHWPVHLSWSGFAANEVAKGKESGNEEPLGTACATEDLSPEELAALRQTLWNMLRRFVAPPWTAGRLGDVDDDS